MGQILKEISVFEGFFVPKSSDDTKQLSKKLVCIFLDGECRRVPGIYNANEVCLSSVLGLIGWRVAKPRIIPIRAGEKSCLSRNGFRNLLLVRWLFSLCGIY